MVMKTANKMAKKSRGTQRKSGAPAKPARSRSDGMGQKSETAGVFAATHTGPYLGKRSV